jgi:hypothetical protein
MVDAFSCKSAHGNFRWPIAARNATNSEINFIIYRVRRLDDEAFVNAAWLEGPSLHFGAKRAAEFLT